MTQLLSKALAAMRPSNATPAINGATPTVSWRWPGRRMTGIDLQGPQTLRHLGEDDLREIYRWRHLVENFFGKLKEFKRIAMRSDKTDQSFAAMIQLASAVINSR
jgi:hypothetical protein